MTRTLATYLAAFVLGVVAACLAKRLQREIEEMGDSTCDVCGVVMAICARCYRTRPKKADAMAARFIVHVKTCAADAREILTRSAEARG